VVRAVEAQAVVTEKLQSRGQGRKLGEYLIDPFLVIHQAVLGPAAIPSLERKRRKPVPQ
jgi:hypothetical protein